ncbi:hypothetical protein PK35_02750 [Tamlana nanhaiensis]|uniref:histidine kinase n=1 Tax=Neotamlana nanhaiensis TaxID=1382798 RepID=A0A0D7W6B7_9FLAO|nr:two-component regulator propeller domain-containing protein [Tamlana nanhaiensis]KJD34696.1 hypothetical protein PK35_02750 [Tamlana nanhaiensis]
MILSTGIKKVWFLVCFACVSLLGAQNKSSQHRAVEDELTFYLLDVELGLSNNGINSIEQDSLGFIWVGTPEGLNRYDGTQFKVFKKGNTPNKYQLNDNFIHKIQLVDKHQLYIATNEGLNIYDFKQETFQFLNTSNGLLGSNNVSSFSKSTSNLILGVYNYGVQVSYNQGDTNLFEHSPNNPETLSSNQVLSVLHQNDSVVWVGTEKHGLNKINLNTKKVNRVPIQNHLNLRINQLYTDKQNNLWIGSNEGVHVFTTHGDTLNIKKSNTEGVGLSDNNVLCFEEDNNNQMWIGTRNGGLNILNTSSFLNSNTIKTQWYLPQDDGSSVFNRTVLALKLDWDNNMWIGTSTGLNYVNPNGEPIKLLRKNSSKKESIGHDRVGALTESFNQNIWIGTDGAGLDLLNPKTGTIKHFVHHANDAKSLSNDYIISLLEDSKNRLWVGTYQGGLNKMDIKTGRCKHYLQGDITEGSDVRVIFEDAKGTIWVGTNRGGLYKYNESTDTFSFVNVLGKIDVRDISEDDKGYFWMATYGNGILKYNPTTNETFFYNTSNISTFKTNLIYSILALSSGNVLAGTLNEGLLLLNPVQNTVKAFTEADGLSNNTVCSMVLEDATSIWLGTHRGISNFDPSSNTIYNLNTYTNIQQGKFNIGSSLITNSGVLYFGGDKGLNVFNPEKLKIEAEKHPIVIEKLEVLNKEVQVNESFNDNVILNNSIQFQDHIALDYHQTFFSLDYVSLKYPFVKNTKYAYKIDGYQDQWVDTDGTGKVNLINMPHGKYVLNVKAKFGSGDEIIKKLNITVNPPFWKTLWAYLIYLVVSSLLLYAILKYLAERITLLNSLSFEKKQRQLEHNFNEERIRFFTSFSHELKTPLTLILAPLEDLLSEITLLKHKKSLQLIQKNANQLLQSINRLLEFRKSNLGLSKLRIENHNLTELLEQWVNNYFPLAKKRGITLSFKLPDENFYAWFDLEKMHIIVNNLLSNAFKYTPDNGKIKLSLDYNENAFTIKVKDTGYGISESDLELIFERYYQSPSTNSKNGLGIGLALSKNFTELHMGTINIKSELKKGSTFLVTIPRDKSLFNNVIIDGENTKQARLDTLEKTELIADVEPNKPTNPNLNLNDKKQLILLVDDNPDILSYLDTLLDGQHDLIYANDGEEGVQKAMQYIPDLIISDVMMPKMNGLELCNKLKENIETTHIPIILLTAKGNTESIEEGYMYGADDYITKPFSGKILQARIQNILENRTQLRNYFLNKNSAITPITNNGLIQQEKEFLIKLEAVILEYLDLEKVDVKLVSTQMGMSRTSLFRKLKAITGLNINQYIRKVKIDKAAELIRSGNYTIAQASYEVGFKNVKYFRKLFKEQFNYLPSKLSKNKTV